MTIAMSKTLKITAEHRELRELRFSLS
jgi:hypothetical protein